MYGHVSSMLGDKGRQVFTVERAATVRQAVAQMNERAIGALLIVEDGSPVGIFTERDVLRRIVAEGRNPDTVRVAEVMTKEVLTVELATTVEEVMATMTARRLRHLPVVDNGQLVGMISIGDVTRYMSVNQEAHIQRMTDYITGRAPA